MTHRAILIGILLSGTVPAFSQRQTAGGITGPSGGMAPREHASTMRNNDPALNRSTESHSETNQIPSEVRGPGFDPTPVRIPSIVNEVRRPITSMDLLTIRDLKGVQISPDGKNVVFVVSQAVYGANGYRTGLFVVGTEPGSKPVSLGSGGPPRWSQVGEYLPEPPSWSPDSRYITYRLKRGETWQIWRWNREGGDPIQLTHNPHDVQTFEWSPDGNRIIFETSKSAGPEEARRFSERGMLYDDNIAPFLCTPIVDMQRQRVLERETWFYETATGKESKATSEEIRRYSAWHRDPEDPDIGNAKLSPDGNTLAFTRFLRTEETKTRRAYNSLFVRSIKNGKVIDLTQTMAVSYVAEFWWGSDGRDVYFLARLGDDDPPSLYVVASIGGEARKVIHFNTGFSQTSLDTKATFAAGVSGTTTTPDQVALVDLKTGAVQTLVNVNPEFSQIQLSPVLEIKWKNENGGTDFGYLIKPFDYEQGKTYPLIVTTYRVTVQGFQRGAVGDEYPEQVFAANGFAVLAIDVGILQGYESGRFQEARTAIWFSLIPNLEAAVKVVEDMGIADPERKGITGLSYGARIVDFMISHSNLFQAAIASQLGTDDPYSYYIGGGAYQRHLATWGLGGLPEGEAWTRWREVSPALNAQQVKSPLLVNAADSEFRLGLQFYTSLKLLGKPLEVFLYPDEFHEKNQPTHRFEIYQRNLDWFKFWLKAEEDPAPEKAQQYARWRQLRKLQEENKNGLTTSKATSN